MASLQDGDPRNVAAYRLTERLAVGGMGIVYLGESPDGALVAVKLIRPDRAGDPEFRARFRREVKAARSVSGSHTAAVVDADPDADPPWLVTEYVAGPSLQARVTRDGPLDPAAVQRLAAGLAAGLHAIHSSDLVHRDLKPLNVIMASDGPRIIDFGIAKAAGASSDPRLTATGTVVGTPAFLSPEQLNGRPAGPASDIFSFGSVVAFAAAGRAPFDAGTFTATSYAIVNKPPDLRPLTGRLLDIITACLAKDPGARPTAAGLLSYLSRTRPARPGLVRAPARRPAVPGPPRLQVRPARSGWRLVTASADGRWFATANGDGIITAWLAPLAPPAQPAPLALPVRSWPAGARVRAMAADGGDLLVVATDDGRVTAWDVAAGAACRYLPETVPGLTGPEVRVRCLALDRSGTWLAASAAGRLLLWDVADPSEPLLSAVLPCPAEVTALAFDGLGWRLAAGDEGGQVHVWDLANPVDATPGIAVSGRVLALAWDDARSRWLSAGGAGPGGSAGGSLRAAALSPAGGFSAMIDDARGYARLTSLDDPAQPRVLDGTDLVITGVAFAGSGMLALAGGDGSLRLWDRSRQVMQQIRATGSPVAALAFSPNGSQLIISHRRYGLTSFSAVNGSLEPGWTSDSPESAECVAFRADGTRLATAGDAVRIWHGADGTLAGVLPGRTGHARAVAADQAGPRIAAAWAEAVVTVWEGRNLLWELTGHKGAVLTLAFGPRPGLLTSAGDDETIRTWDLATGKQTACQSPAGCRVTVLAASRDGTMLAAGCADGTVRLCAAGPPGTLPGWADAPVLTGHAHGITAMSFDVSGRLLATGSRDGTARIWDLATRSATAVLLPEAAAVVSPDGTWCGLGETGGLIWQAAGLARVPLPIVEAVR